jgi:molybdopterin-guanine dinucleotide biosynthesis protein
VLKESVIITVSGPDHSGKGHIVAAVAHCLEAMGCLVSIQAAETHNASKLAKDDAAIANRIRGQRVVLLEQRT